MIVYWLMYLLPTLVAVLPLRGTTAFRNLAWVIIGTATSLLVGLRHEVGADWHRYSELYDLAADGLLLEAVLLLDPAYGALNWLMASLGTGVHAVNLICAGVFVTGLIIFCRHQPLPWLAFAIAIPYATIVVAMGYTRQSAALGLILAALTTLHGGQLLRYMLLVSIAALFHKSALLMLPIGLAARPAIGPLGTFALVGAAGIALWLALVQASYEALWESYVVEGMVSEGGTIRVWMNAVPAVLFLMVLRRWRVTFQDVRVWLAISALALVSMALVDYASTAVDRVALYFIPLQVAVFSRLPVLIREPAVSSLVTLGTLAGYGAVLWVWLHYAIHAEYWFPYRNLLFM